MKFPLLFALLLPAAGLFAQVGLSGGYHTLRADDWYDQANILTGSDFSQTTGRSLSADYWFRLPGARIEFLPTLSFANFSADQASFRLEQQMLGLHLHTNIYLFDLEGDCDCPTWSKEGNLLQKGFFVQLSPGVVRYRNTLQQEGVDVLDGKGTALEIGVGAGLDIGLSDLLTLTPHVRYSLAPRADWDLETLPATASNTVIEGSYRQLIFGLRVGFRWEN